MSLLHLQKKIWKGLFSWNISSLCICTIVDVFLSYIVTIYQTFQEIVWFFSDKKAKKEIMVAEKMEKLIVLRDIKWLSMCTGNMSKCRYLFKLVFVFVWERFVWDLFWGSLWPYWGFEEYWLIKVTLQDFRQLNQNNKRQKCEVSMNGLILRKE